MRKVIGYRTPGYSLSGEREWVEICELKKLDNGKKKFERLGYPHNWTEGGLNVKTEKTVQNRLVDFIQISEDFPYFLYQIRDISNSWDKVGEIRNILDDEELTDSGKIRDVKKLTYSIYTTKSSVVLFNPDDDGEKLKIQPIEEKQDIKKDLDEKESTEPVDYPELEFEFIDDRLYKEEIIKSYHELEVLLNNGCHLSSSIMIGSILDGILIDLIKRDIEKSEIIYIKTQTEYLNRRSKSVDESKIIDESKNIKKWNFPRKMNVVKELVSINKQVIDMLFDIQKHRNIVHINSRIENEMVIDEFFVKRVMDNLTYFIKVLSNEFDKVERIE